MGTFQVGEAKVRVWKNGGHWAVTVDDVPVGGRHMTMAQAAGSGLLRAQSDTLRDGAPDRTAVARAGRSGARRKVA